MMSFFVLLLQVAAVLAAAVKKVPFEGGKLVETMIPMRDGVELHTMILFPRGNDGTKKFTAIMDRSPYGYQDLEWITDIFVPFGYVAIGQDMRGTEKSQGNFTMWQSDADDSNDLGNWIVQQEWSNGKVMTFGASADGMGSFQTIKENPSWLAAQYVAWAPSEMYQILFPYGAYKQKTAEDWLLGVTMPNPDVVYDNIQTVHENEAHTDFWRAVELSDADYANVKFPNAFWGGWYDLFILGTIQAYDGYNLKSDPSVQRTSLLTIDPVGHCLEGADFFTQNAVYGRTGVALAQAFEVFGILPRERNAIKNVTFYVMSSNDDAGKAVGQYWTSLETFPTPKMVDHFLHADGTATLLPPTPSESSSTTYKYDPADPVPTLGGNNLPDSIGGSIPCGPLDQTPADQRSDVLKFQTSVLSDPLYLTGPLLATLYVSSDAIDTDFTVKISDVYPTGEARLLQDNAIRMRWREETLTPVYMQKDEVYKVELNLWNTSYVVAPGHALRISVSSSNYPRFSVNPNNGVLLKDPSYPGTNVVAQNTLYHSLRYPSKVSLPVVTRFQIPEVHVIKEVQKSYPELTEEFIAEKTPVVTKMLTRMQRKSKK
mmetsp:Transcript_16047/g.11574  ORF Transcript_16047/g.11574 Transcript_16047/m.11574 type:complete len:599 (-) Transcript_16047:241-2037(-)